MLAPAYPEAKNPVWKGGRLRARPAVFLRVLNVRSHERRPVALLWMQSFFLGVGVAYAVAAALSLFLSSFSVEYLPGVFAAAAFAEYLVGQAVDRLENKFGNARAARALLWFLAIGTLLFWSLLRMPAVATSGHTGAGLAIVFGLLAWSRILAYSSDNSFWGLAQHLFDIRQSKRLFSLIDSGSFLASILGFFSVPLLTPFVPIPDFLLFSAMGTAISSYVLERILYHFGQVLEHGHDVRPSIHNTGASGNGSHGKGAHAHPDSAIRFLSRHRYIASLAVISLLAGIANTCVDYGFLRGIELRTQNMAQIAAFLGIFLGSAKLASLVLKMAGTGRLFAKFGIANTTLVLPAGLFVVIVSGLIVRTASEQTATIWSFTAAMLLVELWSDAVQLPALAIGLQPVAAGTRHRAHQLIGGIVEPLALAAAAGLLFVLSSAIGFSIRGISSFLLVIVVAWVLAIRVFGREYRRTIERALKHRRIRSTEFVWDEAARAVLRAKLEVSLSAEAEYVLRLLPRSEASFFLSILPRLLDRKEEELRLLALERFQEFDFSSHEREEATRILIDTLERANESPTVLGEALTALLKVRPEDGNLLWERWHADARVPVREGLLSGLLKYSVNGELANRKLAAMEASADAHDRSSAARIVGRVGGSRHYRTLLHLITDAEIAVRDEAIRASSTVLQPELIPPLLDAYFDPSTQSQRLPLIEGALGRFGASVLIPLQERIADGRIPGMRWQRTVRLLGQWARKNSDPEFARQAVRMLVHILGSDAWNDAMSIGEMRLTTLSELVASGIRLRDEEFLNTLIEDELGHGWALLRIFKLVEETSVSDEREFQIARSLAGSALAHEIAQAAERLLYALALWFDREVLLKIRDTLLFGENHAHAFETLEHILPVALAGRVVLLFEANLHVNARPLTRHAHSHEGPSLTDLIVAVPRSAGVGYEDPVAQLLRDQSPFYGPWTQVVVLYWAGLLYPKQYAGLLLDTADRSEVIDNTVNRSKLVGAVAKMLLENPPASVAESGNQNAANAFYDRSQKGFPMPFLFERLILLKTVDLFRETPDAVLSHIAAALEEVHLAAGTRIIEKGELGNCLYIITEGRVRVYDGEITLSVLSERDVVGELALLDPEPRSASVMALEETTLLRLDYDAFYDLMVDNIEIARGAIATLCRKIRNQNARLSRAGNKE